MGPTPLSESQEDQQVKDHDRELAELLELESSLRAELENLRVG